jgi:hypothetical protein
MVSTAQPKSPVITESKIIHKSPVLHPLVRFVSEATAAMLLNVEPEQIDRVECWAYVVYVHGKGVSRFISYADFPPILEVEPPNAQDFGRWRKRWLKRWESKQAPAFWTKFYSHQFKYAPSVAELLEWGKLVSLLKSAVSEAALQQLRDAYRQEKYWWENF